MFRQKTERWNSMKSETLAEINDDDEILSPGAPGWHSWLGA